MRNLLLILFLSFVSLSAQKKLAFDFDYSQFAFDSTSNVVEVYYSISKNDLKAVVTNKGRTVSALLNITIKNLRTNSTVLSKKWKITKPLGADSTESNQLLIGVLNFRVPKGDYKIKVKAYDVNDTLVSKSYSEDFKVTPFIASSVKLSYIELAKNIKQTDAETKSIFYKNSYEVTPNPPLLYNSEIPVVFYYSELYNLNTCENNLILDRFLINSQGRKVYEKSRSVKPGNNSVVDVGMINMRNFPTDIYKLIIALRDTVTGTGALSSKKFFYYNPEYMDTTINNLSDNGFIASEFGIMSVDELDLYFDQCRYIATTEEIDQYEKLTTVEGKREFLYNFWKKRDPDKSTKVNEFEEEYKRRIEYVERQFGTMMKHGYESDRGRVYLMYGEYDQIDSFPHPTNRKPYEIWYYNSIEGGVIFIFADLTGYSDYELLHSTKRDEIKDYNWERRIVQY